jgi:hypothetical protein
MVSLIPLLLSTGTSHTALFFPPLKPFEGLSKARLEQSGSCALRFISYCIYETYSLFITSHELRSPFWAFQGEAGRWGLRLWRPTAHGTPGWQGTRDGAC